MAAYTLLHLKEGLRSCVSHNSRTGRRGCYGPERVSPEETSEVLIWSEVVGVAKVANN